MKTELHGIDLSTRFGAWTLAEAIMEVWRRRGYGNVKVERFEMPGGSWSVRSNLVNGVPPSRRF